MNGKCKIWDEQEKCWYKPIYEAAKGKLEDINITQSGELVMRKMNFGTVVQSVHLTSMEPERFKVCYYIGLRDIDEKKWFLGDIIKVINSPGDFSYGVLVWMDDRLGIGSVPKKDSEGKWGYQAIDQITSADLAQCENIGNINSHPNFFEDLTETGQQKCEHAFSKAMDAPRPRKCVKCGEEEKD
jgi:hypothetical protein